LKNPNDIKVDQVLRVAPPDSAVNTAQGVQAIAVTPGTVDLKPLSAPVSSLNKNAPKGDKRTYSESAFAELQKPDNGVPPVLAKSEVANPVIAIKPAEKASDKLVAENEVVDWMWPVDGKVLAGFDDTKIRAWIFRVRWGKMCWLRVLGRSCMLVVGFVAMVIWLLLNTAAVCFRPTLTIRLFSLKRGNLLLKDKKLQKWEIPIAIVSICTLRFDCKVNRLIL